MARRIAFVSGASRGIGKATARALAVAGFDCALAARRVHGGEVHEYSPDQRRSLRRAMPGSLDETAALVREAGREAFVVAMDLLDPASVDAAAFRTLAEFGPVELLVNNWLAVAGVGKGSCNSPEGRHHHRGRRRFL